jgi:hypothetical protein
MARVPDQQYPSAVVDGQDRHRRQQQQLMADDGPQPGYMRSDAHPRNLSCLDLGGY